ncbi:transposase [Trichonephila clavipes]|nr:transposase [Trichonephila clavipes]
MQEDSAVGFVVPPWMDGWNLTSHCSATRGLLATESFHHIPHIFYGTQIRATLWPGEMLEIGLMLSEPILDTSGSMYNWIIVHEVSVAVREHQFNTSRPAERAPYHGTPTRPLHRARKRILFSDEAHLWLNGYVNKQNCRIWSEANPQVYVETPLHPEKLTVWCALWAGGILLQKR